MVKAALRAFDGALDLTYKGFKKLLLFIVVVAVIASTCTVLALAGFVALFN